MNYMFGIIGFFLIVLSIVSLLMFIVALLDSKSERYGTFIAAFAILGILGTICISVVVVDPGQVVVTSVFGTVNEQPLQAGIHIVTPIITATIPYSIKTQEDTQTVTVLTAEGLDVSIDLTVLYHLEPNKAVEMYQTVGAEYKNIVLDPQVRSVVRDIVATYDAKSIYSSDRSNMSVKIFDALNVDTRARGVIIENVLLRSAILPAKVKEAIENKQQAEQKIQQKQFEVQQAQMDAQTAVVKAKGIADSNAIIANSITPEYIEWYTVEMMKDRTGDTYFIPVGNNGLPVVGNLPFKNVVSAKAT